MFWLIVTLVYIISFAIYIVDIWYEDRRRIFKVGDIIDKIEFFMWCPIINTVTIIIVLVYFIFVYLITLTKIEELWIKFKNIKLKQKLWQKIIIVC